MVDELYEVQKFVGTGKPPETVAYGIPDFNSAVRTLNNYVTSNPEYSYRLVRIVIDFIQCKKSEMK